MHAGFERHPGDPGKSRSEDRNPSSAYRGGISYKDFQIYAEFWASDDADGGIFIRSWIPRSGARTCYEVNIYDQRKDPTYGTGSIVYFTEVNPMPKAGGKWNTFEITAKGRLSPCCSTARRPPNCITACSSKDHSRCSTVRA